MTAYLTLKKYPLATTGTGFTVTVTAAEARAEAQDTGQNESVVAVRAGEQLNERQLLEALLIPSGDNIAQILAAYTAGSVSRFVAEMNSTARSLGMDRTTYTDPSGFDPSTVSDPADQIRVFEQAMRFAVFRQIVSMPSATLPVAGTVGNFDPILADGYDGKTGSDSEAEGCLAFFKYVNVGGRRLTVVGVVMGQGYGSTTSVILAAAGAAAERIVSSVVPSIQPRTVVPAGAAVMAATSPDGSRVSAVTAEPLRVISWGGIHERLAFRLGSLGTELDAGQRVGEVTLTRALPSAAGDHERTTVHTARKLSAPGFFWRLGHLL
jgi:serine-type D-Ala-D-Ala carboxypeptidase (penicillin-binding protein 5/6)